MSDVPAARGAPRPRVGVVQPRSEDTCSPSMRFDPRLRWLRNYLRVGRCRDLLAAYLESAA